MGRHRGVRGEDPGVEVSVRVLVACEFSGVVRRAFREKGHDAWSCDLLASEDNSPYHYVNDVFKVINSMPWDLMIAHPPCTYLAGSGLHWNKRIPGRSDLTTEALNFVADLWNAPIEKVCIENPVGCLSTYFNKPSQYIQPWMFGEDASKKTCLWMRNLPNLIPTDIIEKERYANQTPSGQNKLGPSPDRWKERSRTYHGIAKAMAEQWG